MIFAVFNTFFLIGLCPPGTKTQLLNRSHRRRFPDQSYAFMPFCVKCSEGYYQPEYNQTICRKCPLHFTSLPGSTTLDSCYLPQSFQPCTEHLNQCGNQGRCVKSLAKTYYYCKCKAGFYGWRCEHQIDPCLSGPCFNDGECKPNRNHFTCKCSKEFSGNYCELPTPKCHLMDFCQNNGKCTEKPNGEAKCVCKSGFIGDRCEINHDYCADLACEHGNCEFSHKGLICKCHPGYLGSRCHLKPCDYMPCPENKECVNVLSKAVTRASFACECKTGFTGVDCAVKIDPCEPNPCENNGVCEAIGINGTISNYKCTCQMYFFGSQCETLLRPDFELHFEQTGVANYIELEGRASNITEVCLLILMNLV